MLNLNSGGDWYRQLVGASAMMFSQKVNTRRLNTNGKQECEHKVKFETVPDCTVQKLMIGRTKEGARWRH